MKTQRKHRTPRVSPSSVRSSRPARPARPAKARSSLSFRIRLPRRAAITLFALLPGAGSAFAPFDTPTAEETASFDALWKAFTLYKDDAKESFGWTRADFRLDWLHSDHDADDQVLDRYDDIVSATFHAQDGPWGIVAEAFHASGGEGRDEDVFGFFVQSTYDLVPKRLQLVGRYSFASGDGLDSVRRQTRYESEAPALTGGGRGDEYHALYLGAQYFIHGDKLMLLAGAEYATLDGGGNGGDYDGLTWLTGIRFFF